MVYPAYFDHGSLEYAEKCYQNSINSKSVHSAVARSNLMLLNFSQGRFEAAATCGNQLRQSLESNGDHLATLAIIEAYTCEWDNRSKNFEQIITSKSCRTAVQPFHAQIIPMISPQVALEISNNFSQRFHKQALHNNNRSHYEYNPSKPDDVIRIGYISSQFGNSVSSFLAHEIFHLHDRQKFKVYCFCLAGSDVWECIRRNADVFVDLDELRKCVDLADTIHDHGIDILVDLDGYCQGARPSIFSLKPAPIQLTMSCGTMGNESGMDYIVGDRYTIPEDHYSHFSEKVIHVPHPLVSGYTRDLSSDFDKSQIRKRWGIKDDAFVFACFSLPHKICPEIFSLWMEILHEDPTSFLVLLRHSSTMETNLRKEAAKHNIESDRLIFLDFVPRNEHLERCCLADVFLDTVVCSGIATGCDALWSGCPMITIAGDRFCNRVGASLLAAAGLEEFIASNLLEYKNLALSLAQSAEEDRIDIINLLYDARENSSLFDGKQWVNAFEGALEAVMNRQRNGLKPDHITIQQCDFDSESTQVCMSLL